MFILGIYFIYYGVKYPYKLVEGFDEQSGSSPKTYSCPNLLVQKGTEIYLYDKTKIEVPGVNPIKFNHLDEYVEFMEWQQSQNINCPALYLQYSFDSQGNETYKLRPSILEPEGGLNPSSCPKEDTDTNVVSSHPSSSSTATSSSSTNAMDDNWGGQEFTEKAVENGEFANNYVYKVVG
jgi:hypothetical protein